MLGRVVMLEDHINGGVTSKTYLNITLRAYIQCVGGFKQGGGLPTQSEALSKQCYGRALIMRGVGSAPMWSTGENLRLCSQQLKHRHFTHGRSDFLENYRKPQHKTCLICKRLLVVHKCI